jgi:hypothetical protein
MPRVSDPPDDEIQVIQSTYGSGEKPRDLTFTFRRHGKKLPSREVERDGDRFFIVALPDGAVSRFRQNPKSRRG